jgi:hypothetical protein
MKTTQKLYMKKLVLPLSVLFLIMSCSDEEVKPAVEIASEYYLQLNEQQIEIGLTVINNDEIRTFSANAYLKHPSIPENSWRANNLFTYNDQDDKLYRIEILARGPHFYAVDLVDVRLTDDGLYVLDVYIDIMGEPFMELQGQVFRKR